MLERHAAEVKDRGQPRVLEPNTQRFNACVDADGKSHDYGFTFLNLEAVYYDFATPEHAAADPELDQRRPRGGRRHGPGQRHLSLAVRPAIHHQKRNLDWYFWAWNNPGEHPLGRTRSRTAARCWASPITT